MREISDDIKFFNASFPKDENDHDMLSCAFYFGFIFKNGMRADFRERAINTCADYWNLCGNELVWMTSPKDFRWQKIPQNYSLKQWESDLAHAIYKKFEKKPNQSSRTKSQREIRQEAIEGSHEFQNEMDWHREFPKKDWVWQMSFHSGRSGSEAAQYQIAAHGNSSQTFGSSYLYFYLPLNWFLKNEKFHPIELYLRWANIIKADFGTAGIGLVPATYTPSISKTSDIAESFADRFPGIELADPLGQNNAFFGLLSPNWLNLINTETVTRLGGIENIQKILNSDPLGECVGIHEYDGGIIFSSGEHPKFMEDKKYGMPPKSYGPVARLLKRFRTTQAWGGWGCPEEKNIDWMARFDK